MPRIFVTPKPGLSIRDPLNPAVRLAAEGDWRDDATAYRRMERTGDVSISAGPQAAGAATAGPEAKPKK